MKRLWVALRIAIAVAGGVVGGLLAFLVLLFTVDKRNSFWNNGHAADWLFWLSFLAAATGAAARLFPAERRAVVARIASVPGWGWRIAASLAGGGVAAWLPVELCYLQAGRYRYCARGIDGMTDLLAAVGLSTAAVLLVVLFRRAARRG